MKKVRNNLNEVLEEKSNEDWLNSEGTCVFLCVGVVECKKTLHLKTEISSPLKTVSFYISRVSDLQASHEPTREKCRCIGQIFVS